jgi:hypothetical protein
VTKKKENVFCSLVFDEIAIRQHIQFDGHKYYGYVDMGATIEYNDLQVGKEALVFMVVAINGGCPLLCRILHTCAN